MGKSFGINGITTYGHPWIAKIEAGTMRIEDAVEHLRGSDNYTYKYKLNAYTMRRKA